MHTLPVDVHTAVHIKYSRSVSHLATSLKTLTNREQSSTNNEQREPTELKLTASDFRSLKQAERERDTERDREGRVKPLL